MLSNAVPDESSLPDLEVAVFLAVCSHGRKRKMCATAHEREREGGRWKE